MAWMETTKIELINEWRSGAYTISELSCEFGVSRLTVYKYITRYQKEGLRGLDEKCRAHVEYPARISSEIGKSIIELRKRYPRWGGKRFGKYSRKNIKTMVYLVLAQ